MLAKEVLEENPCMIIIMRRPEVSFHYMYKAAGLFRLIDESLGSVLQVEMYHLSGVSIYAS